MAVQKRWEIGYSGQTADICVIEKGLAFLTNLSIETVIIERSA